MTTVTANTDAYKCFVCVRKYKISGLSKKMTYMLQMAV